MADAPNIRFKGFTDDWEQRKLESIIEDYVEKSTVENQYPVLTSSQQKGIVLQDDYFKGDRVSQSGNVGYFIIPRGYFTYRSRSDNDVFVFNRNDCVDKGIISYFYPVFKPKDVDSDFLLRRLNNGLEAQLRTASEGTGQHVLSLKKFKCMTALFPSISEQRQIGDYFRNLDQLITLHQRKCDETKELKKYMLQKMFPQNGKKIPEIRFAGFTDDWEQHKLRNIADKVTMKNAGTQYVETFTNSAEFGIISQRDFFDHDVSNMENIDGYYIVEDDAFVYNPRISTSAPVGPINRNKLGRTGVMSPLYTVFKTHDIDSEYLEWFFKSSSWYSFMYFNGDTGARSDRFSIKDAVFFEMPIPIPDIGEQRKIGKYLTQLDSFVILHQRKCDQLKEVKKFMLQNMFPQKG